MSGSMKGLMAAVVIVGVVAWFATQEEKREAPRSLSLDGFATAEQLEAEKNRGMLDPREEIPSPIDEILIERSDAVIHLKRRGEGKDSTWTLLKPVEAKATRFQANKMANLFKTGTRSVYSTRTSPEELGLYDLEPERRITVKLKANGALWNDVDLVIGKVQRTDSETAEQDAKHDTWVARGEDLETVYRVAGKDLRTAFAVPLVELRDKAIFDAKAEELAELRVTAPSGEVVLLKAISAVAPKGGADSGAARAAAPVWTLSEPAGFEADETVSSLARSFTGVRTRDFVVRSKAPKAALQGPTWKLEGKTRDGRDLSLVIEAGDEEQVFAQASNVAELLKVDQFTAKNLRKGLADLRHRGLFKLSTEAVESVTFAPEGGSPIRVTKTPAGWRGPKSKRRLDVESLLHGLLSVKASRYARPSEIAEAKDALAKPDFVAGVQTSDSSLSITFGPKMSHDPVKGQRWARIEGGPGAGAPMLVQDHLAKRFRKGLEELAWKKLFDGSSADIETVEILHAGEPPVRLKKGEGPSGLVLVAPPEGASPVPAAINGIGAALSSARAKSFVGSKQAKDAGLGSASNLRVSWTSGEETYALEISDQADGQDPYAKMTGGPLDGLVITLARFQADKLRKRTTDLAQ